MFIISSHFFFFRTVNYRPSLETNTPRDIYIHQVQRPEETHLPRYSIVTLFFCRFEKTYLSITLKSWPVSSFPIPLLWYHLPSRMSLLITNPLRPYKNFLNYNLYMKIQQTLKFYSRRDGESESRFRRVGWFRTTLVEPHSFHSPDIRIRPSVSFSCLRSTLLTYTKSQVIKVIKLSLKSVWGREGDEIEEKGVLCLHLGVPSLWRERETSTLPLSTV